MSETPNASGSSQAEQSPSRNPMEIAYQELVQSFKEAGFTVTERTRSPASKLQAGFIPRRKPAAKPPAS